MSIEDYKFSDPDFICRKSPTSRCLDLLAVKATPYAHLGKDDVIALAKHFKLTPEDIKD